jgi:hypothetical protein
MSDLTSVKSSNPQRKRGFSVRHAHARSHLARLYRDAPGTELSAMLGTPAAATERRT